MDIYDLIFLDIHLDNVSGLTIGKEIRKQEDFFINKIIFFSSDETKSMEVINIEPFGFIKKPIDKKELEKVIERFLKRYRSLQETFNYKFNKIYYRLLIKDIMYFESSNKKIIIHKINGDIKIFYDKLDLVEKKLNSQNFLRASKSFLINIKYIEKARHDEVILFNGKSFGVSRGFRKKVTEQIMINNLKGW